MSPEEIRRRVFAALEENASYRTEKVLGLPGSVLDREVFPRTAEMTRYPWLSCLMDNPNHIGCHTTEHSEPAFRGTQHLELDLLRLCAEGLLRSAPQSYDGYVGSGGTEANIQALWTYRNSFRQADGAARDGVGVLCSADTHYSVFKAANLMDLPVAVVAVEDDTRAMRPQAVEAAIARLRREDVTHVVALLNMGTTMFGSVDDPDVLLTALDAHGVPYRAHVDAAFGGFIYPLTTSSNPLSFADSRISSFTLDGHKMLQAPYGTGIHLIRKGFIDAVCTDAARYVPGLDATLVGSRSGANAVAMWMILQSYGYEGGKAFCTALVRRAERLCKELTDRRVRHFHQPGMNIVAMRAEDVPSSVVQRFMLVPDSHDGPPRWVKAVIMDHVGDELLEEFLRALDRARASAGRGVT